MLYEIVPAAAPASGRPVSGHPERKPAEPKSASPQAASPRAEAPELLRLKLVWSGPAHGQPQTRELPLADPGRSWPAASPDFHWTAAIAGYGLLLRGSPEKEHATWDLVRELGREGKANDPDGRRADFLRVIEEASKAPAPAAGLASPPASR